MHETTLPTFRTNSFCAREPQPASIPERASRSCRSSAYQLRALQSGGALIAHSRNLDARGDKPHSLADRFPLTVPYWSAGAHLHSTPDRDAEQHAQPNAYRDALGLPQQALKAGLTHR